MYLYPKDIKEKLEFSKIIEFVSVECLSEMGKEYFRNITILDNNDRFLPVLQESMDQHRKDLTISKLVVNSAEKMSAIESNSMDAVVHTFVLCSISDTTSTLKEIYRVLK